MAPSCVKAFYPIILLVVQNVCKGLEVKPQLHRRSYEGCLQQSKQPYFDIDLVLGKPWRIYYTWNVQMEDRCLDMTVKNATAKISSRIYHDMHEYLETQPVWEAATLLISLGTAKHELLLFADQGAAGNFVAVPNVVADGSITPIRMAVPLLRFFLKVIHEGKYLLMMDCHIGVASLLSREHPPYMLEIASVAQSLNLGPGYHACISSLKKDEQVQLG